MVIVNTWEDIQKAIDVGNLDRTAMAYLKACFLTLSGQLNPGMPPEVSSLEKYGCIVFLQDESDCRALSKVGLHSEYCRTFPESVEKVCLQGADGMNVFYNACIAINNGICITVVSRKGTLGDENERFLTRECG